MNGNGSLFSANRLAATGFLFPAIVAVLLMAALPLGMVLSKAFYDTQVHDAFPATLEALSGWDEQELLPDSAQAALAQDLRSAYAAQTLAGAASKLNERANGLRSAVMATARRLARNGEADIAATLEQSSPLWAAPETWATIKAAGRPFSLANLGRVFAPSPSGVDGSGTAGGVYGDMLARTLTISFSVTLLTVLIGYPLAYALTFAPLRLKRPLFVLSFIPLWMSLLGRAAAWVILLQKGGVVDMAARALGVATEPLELLYSRAGVYVAMTHVLLPCFVYPCYSAMANIPRNHVTAALSLGASGWRSFWIVFVPQTLGGVAAGATLVFVLSMGFYLTPALVGGPADQMLSYMVSEITLRIGDTGMASTLAALLIVAMMIGALTIHLAVHMLRRLLLLRA
ncbi:putative spermidine/putrescine transport system permease protein [Aquamicrobium terrae]